MASHRINKEQNSDTLTCTCKRTGYSSGYSFGMEGLAQEFDLPRDTSKERFKEKQVELGMAKGLKQDVDVQCSTTSILLHC